jgi:hypothetical protein
MCCCVLQNKKPRVGLVPVVAVAVAVVLVLVLVQVLVQVLALVLVLMPSIGQVCAIVPGPAGSICLFPCLILR